MVSFSLTNQTNKKIRQTNPDKTRPQWSVGVMFFEGENDPSFLCSISPYLIKSFTGLGSCSLDSKGGSILMSFLHSKNGLKREAF